MALVHEREKNIEKYCITQSAIMFPAATGNQVLDLANTDRQLR